MKSMNPLLCFVLLTVPLALARADGIVNGDFDAPFPAFVSHFVPNWHHYGTPTSRLAVVTDPDPVRGRVLRLDRGVRQQSGFRELHPERDYRLSFWVRAEHATPEVELSGQKRVLPGLPETDSFEWTRIDVPLPAAERQAGQTMPNRYVVNLHLLGRARQAQGAVFFDDVRIMPEGAEDCPSLDRIRNGSFEETVTDLRHPVGWAISDHPQEGHPVFGAAAVDLDSTVFKTGTAALRVRGRQSSALLQQHVDLTPFRERGVNRIRFEAWVRTRGLEPNACAQVQIGGQYASPFLRVFGDTDWTFGSEIVDLRYVSESRMRIALRLPYATTGTAWFDGIRITEVADDETHNLLRNARFLQTGAHPRLPLSWGFHRWGRLGLQDHDFETYRLDDTHAPPLPAVRVLRFHNPGPVFRDPAMRGDMYRISEAQRTQIGWVGYSRGNQQAKEIQADEDLVMTFSAYFRAETPETVVRINGAGLRRLHDFSVGTDWKRHPFTFGGGQDGFFGGRHVQDLSINLPQGGATVWMAAPQLEIGDTLRPFAPGPGEVDPPDPAARNPILPDPDAPDPRDPFAGLGWRIPEPRLALQPDGSLVLDGALFRAGPLVAERLRLHVAFPGQRMEGVDHLTLAAGTRVEPFRLPGLRMLPAVVEHVAVRFSLHSENGEDLGEAVLPLTRCDRDVKLWREPLSVWVEYNTITTDPDLRVRMHWHRDQPVEGRAWIADADGTRRSEPVRWSFDEAGWQDLSLQVEGLAEGDYAVWVEAGDAPDAWRAMDAFAKRPPPEAEPVRMNRFTRGFEVEGEPFVPTFLPSSLSILDDAMLATLRNAGFNTVCSGIGPLPLEQLHASGVSPEWMEDARFHLDRLSAAGMRLIYRTESGWGLRQWYDQKSLFDGDIDLLARNKVRVVEALRDRPELVGWYFLDEPSIGNWERRFGYQESDMARLYRRIKAADPTRPVFINWNNTWPGEPYGGIDATDVLCHDDYGIARRPLFNVDQMVAATRMINNDVVGRRPAMIWTCGSYPIYHEVAPWAVHVHGWVHLVYGTRGIGYWSTQPMNPDTWQAMQQLNHDAQALAATVFGAPSSRLLQTTVHNTHIHYAVWQTPKHTALLAINTAAYAVPLEVRPAQWMRGIPETAVPLFDGSPIRLEKGVLSTMLPAFSRRVYTFSHDVD